MKNWIALVPEFILIATVGVSVLVWMFRDKATPKTFYTIAKYGVLLVLLSSVVLYDQSFYPKIYENNPYTTLFKSFIYLGALANMSLAVRFFLSTDTASFRFYVLQEISLLFLCAAISFVDVRWLFCCLEVGFLFNYHLIMTENDEEDNMAPAKTLVRYSVLFSLATLVCAFVLSYLAGGGDFQNVAALLQKNPVPFHVYICGAFLIVSVLFKLGAAPFHFCLPTILGRTILPVSGYLALVPVLAYYAVLIILLAHVVNGIYDVLRPAMFVFAVASILVGAVGANTETNLRKMFAYVRIFAVGVVLALLIKFEQNSVFSSFIYLSVCVLTMLGVYAVFYGFKSRGEYLDSMVDVAGVSSSKPFLAAALLIFLFSLLGLPPFLGFLGLLSVVNTLVAQQNYWLIFVVLSSLVVLGAAFLRIIKVIYFDRKNLHFDRVDKGIYLTLAINLFIIAVLMINPKYLMNDIEVALWTLIQ